MPYNPDEWETIWNGSMGELLPPRPTQPDGRWNGMPMVDDAGPQEKYDETRNTKSHYRKVNLAYWNQRGDLPTTSTEGAGLLRSKHYLSRTVSQDQTTAQRGRSGG